MEEGRAVEFLLPDEKSEDITHYFRIVHDTPLNKSNQDFLVTFVQYWQEDTKTEKILRFSWITGLDVTEDNAYLFMRGAHAGGRSRMRPPTP